MACIFLRLVPDVEVGLVQKLVETGNVRLHSKMVAVDRAQQKRAQFARAAKLQKLAGMRQLADRILRLLKAGVEPDLKLRQRDMGHVPLVKNRERQAKLRPESSRLISGRSACLST